MNMLLFLKEEYTIGITKAPLKKNRFINITLSPQSYFDQYYLLFLQNSIKSLFFKSRFIHKIKEQLKIVF